MPAAGKVSKKDLRIGRFRDTLLQFGHSDESLSQSIAQQYEKRSPYQKALLPDTISTLDFLVGKGYHMHIITNGFEEVQHIKIEESGLKKYFAHVITSEMVSQRKPHPKIFEHAMTLSGASVDESIMIGDNMRADILGAQSFGMDQVFFNPKGIKHDESPSFEIKSLKELSDIL